MHLHAIITRLLYAAPRQYSFKFLQFINYLSWLLSSITPHEPPRHRRMTYLRYSPAEVGRGEVSPHSSRGVSPPMLRQHSLPEPCALGVVRHRTQLVSGTCRIRNRVSSIRHFARKERGPAGETPQP
jgi:hypothetical protein